MSAIHLSPSWLFSAQAVHAASDPHLPPGVHLRIQPAKALGLPVAPFEIWRFRLHHALEIPETYGSRQVVWSNGRGERLTPPFDVTPGEPVTGWIPAAAGVCCWIDVDAEAAPDGLQVEAAVNAEGGGYGVVDGAAAAPYRLAASQIHRVIVKGRGRVDGATWINARAFEFLQDAPVWRTLPLPTPSGPRYRGVDDPEVLAMARVRRGAPRRVWPNAWPDVRDLWALPALRADDEVTRVSGLAAEVRPWVAQLVNDTSAPPWELAQTVSLREVAGAETRSMRVNTLGAVLQAALDPGVARWLGFMEHDESPEGIPGVVVAYVVRGLFLFDRRQIDGKVVGDDAATALLRSRSLSPKAVHGSVIEVGAVACATLGAGGFPPAPVIESVSESDRGREVNVSGLRPGASVAFARRAGGRLTALNDRPRVAAGAGGGTPGTGTFFDRAAPFGAAAYRLAQADWFGRWSAWSEQPAGVLPRPLPPVPVLNMVWREPSLQLRAAVPRADTLAPGSHALEALRLEVSIDGRLATQEVPLPEAAAAAGSDLAFALAGPALPRAGSCRVAVVARWVADGGEVLGPPCEPVTRELFDPRPPEAVSLPGALRYTSRPDPLGLARFELEWPPCAGAVGYRVYVCDETHAARHLARVTDPRAEAALDALTGEDVVARAAALVSVRDLLARDAFEPLTATLVREPRYRHEVSGSLRVLTLYRVASVSAAAAETPFGETPLVPVAVPTTYPMAQPLLEVRDGRHAGATVFTLRLRVGRGSMRPATEYRLRRSRVDSAEPLLMPIAAVGPIPPPPADPATPYVVEVEDRGGLYGGIALPLVPWTTYTWRAEVRAGAEPGGGPAGQWSEPSGPVSMMAVADPPVAVTELRARPLPGGAGNEITWRHPDALLGGERGTYRFEVYRQPPGLPGRLLATLNVPAAGRDPDAAARHHDAEPAVPEGTRYTVILIDPIGRQSPAATAVVSTG